MQKSSIKLGARIEKDVKGAAGERSQAQTLDFRSAAAIPEFTLADPLANATGKRVATNSGMKTTFAAESSLNIARRTKMGCVPLGCAVEDDAAITEELSIENLDLSSRSRQLMPRRPAWSYEISSGRLHHREAQSFRKWLDDVQEMIQERGGYPPAYETNLQVWRQLWRVLERCHVAVVVLDARHPLLHLPPALVYHVNRTLRKPLVVVMNKLDAVEPENAVNWAKALADVPGISAILGFSKEDLRERAFSGLRIGKAALIEVCHEAYTEHLAKHPAAKAEAEAATVKAEVPDPDPDPTAAEVEDADFAAASSFNGARAGFFFGTGVQGTGYYRDMQANAKTAAPARARAPAGGYAPAIPAAAGSGAGPEDLAIPEGSIMLGLVGHPNVGKSSMVNSLMGGKVVSVKATPGHTKTLQTLKLDDKTCLCDSPGVVFPRLEVPREAQIVGMLMPLAQVREPFSAIRWVMERSMRPLPEHLGLKPVTLKRVWELQDLGLETLRVDLVAAEQENDTVPWSPMLLCAQMAAQRGFMRSGRPDCVKAGTEILERVLQGRVPYCVPPPSPGGSKAAQAVDDGESSSDYACDDEDYESEQEEEEVGDRDLLELYGLEARGIGRSSQASIKRFRRRQKLAEIAGEADPARTMRPYAGRLKEVEAE